MAYTLSKGTTLTVGGKTVKGLTEIAIPEVSVETLDVTTHSTTGNYKEKISGLMDIGEISFSGLFIASDEGQAFLRANAGANSTFTITLPNGVAFAGSCIVGGTGGALNFSAVATFTGKLIPSGQITVTETV